MGMIPSSIALRAVSMFGLAFLVMGCLPGCSGGGGQGSGASLSVVEVDRGPGLTEVALNRPIVFLFSDEVDPATVHSDTIRIRRLPERAVSARGEFLVSGKMVTFVPDLPSDLNHPEDGGYSVGATYEIIVKSGDRPPYVKSMNGGSLLEDEVTRFSVSKDEPFYDDLVSGPPRVLSSSPELGLTDPVATLDTEGEVVIHLSEPLLPGSVVDPGSVFLSIVRSDGTTQAVSRDVHLRQTAVSASLSIRSLRVLPASSRLLITLTSVLRDLAGNRLTPYVGVLEAGPAGSASGVLVEEFEESVCLEDECTADATSSPGILRASLGPGGDGHDGDLIVADETVLDSDANQELHLRRLIVPRGTTLRLVGSLPLCLFVTDEVVIDGVIELSGGPGERAIGNDAPGSLGGVGGPGGGAGGSGGSPAHDRESIDGETGLGPAEELLGGGVGGTDRRSLGGGGGGGGGGNFEAGEDGENGSGFGGEMIGDPSLDPGEGFLLGGGGGGGGAADDDLIGIQNDGGAGGGGGGGVVRIVCSDRLSVGGRIFARGGSGGDNPGAGGAGGGGAGGSILLQGEQVDLMSGCVLSFQGGDSGSAAGFGQGGAGGAGRLRLSDEDGVVFLPFGSLEPARAEEEVVSVFPLSRGAGVSFARSGYYAPRVLSPDYSFDSSDPQTGFYQPGEDLILAAPLLDGVEIRLRFQGVPQDDLDPSRPADRLATGWVTNINELDGLPFLRFEVEFRLPFGLNPLQTLVGIAGIQIRYREL